MGHQLSLYDQFFKVQEKLGERLNPARWDGSFNARECSFHQLAPYVGKLKSGMVRVLLEEFTKEADVVLDPFCGSGVVPLEAALLNRDAIGNDLNLYAYVLTMGKLFPPRSLEEAVRRARDVVERVETEAKREDLSGVPKWVREFFHPRTLRETLSAFRILRKQKDYFLLACLLGILHHVRPGFLSYPASHLTPYLRKKIYPRDSYPQMYEYRDLRSRLLAKVERAFSRPPAMQSFLRAHRQVYQENAMSLPLRAREIDAIISSPPYFGALDYGRDNRLRLWFLGLENYKELDKILTADDTVYLPQMKECLAEMIRVLRPDGYCVLILGDVHRNGRVRKTAEIICDLAGRTQIGERDGWVYSFKTYAILTDEIPDERRSRRNTKTTKNERILIMKKSPLSRA
ncbi:MAG: DNA adenine methylase [Acidobacteria bacterium]|nr:DNA adenine methylase [Acidobacteriota bacterium]